MDRGRAWAIGGSIALAVGALGVVVGRASAPDVAAVAATPSTVSAAAPATEAPESTSVVTTVPPPATDAPAAGAGTDASAAATEATIAAGDEAASGPGGGAGSFTEAAYPEPAQMLLGERRFDDGSVVRLHGQWYEGDLGSGWPEFPDWTPAAWCSPTGSLRVGIATPDSVNVSWAPWYREPKDGLSVTTFATGHVEGAPRFGVIAQVADDATAVTLTTPAGTDRAVPIATEAGGLAILMVTGPIADELTIGIERSGAVDTVERAELIESWSSPEYRDACQPPPPALPDPGEQPADPATAEAAIRDALSATRSSAYDDRLAAVDDGTGLVAAWDSIADGAYAETAAAATFTVRELVFTSPTEAWFRYDIDSPMASFADRYGMAVLGEDGVWRLTRQSVCQDLALVPGTTCVPSVSQLLPPSAADDPRYGGGMLEG
ncbi:MAG: hypothetical protein KDB40_01370 [Acidimicrobiales bacterium]|nr:hypothetical protein [Acidimicrobiales bacterium]MCB9395433.1 hypothetical protein [Acidimicrobiaceae bacterium]